ncbi:hypothetical protein AB0J80_28205 [Actinoplanes sp. NPDC049548]|uniref:hypothetical protein n=1 Tax=Actinoplanes sp. NPDC049548 TaxID=3155152 RepID=UPI0034483061
MEQCRLYRRQVERNPARMPGPGLVTDDTAYEAEQTAFAHSRFADLRRSGTTYARFNAEMRPNGRRLSPYDKASPIDYRRALDEVAWACRMHGVAFGRRAGARTLAGDPRHHD